MRNKGIEMRIILFPLGSEKKKYHVCGKQNRTILVDNCIHVLFAVSLI